MIELTGKSDVIYRFSVFAPSLSDLQNSAGIFAILDEINGSFSPIFIGESEKLLSSLSHAFLKSFWMNKSRGSIHYAVLYTPHENEKVRSEIVNDIKSNYPGLF